MSKTDSPAGGPEPEQREETKPLPPDGSVIDEDGTVHPPHMVEVIVCRYGDEQRWHADGRVIAEGLSREAAEMLAASFGQPTAPDPALVALRDEMQAHIPQPRQPKNVFPKRGRCKWHGTVFVEMLPEQPGKFYCFPCANEQQPENILPTQVSMAGLRKWANTLTAIIEGRQA